jgi:hypothetical protein
MLKSYHPFTSLETVAEVGLERPHALGDCGPVCSYPPRSTSLPGGQVHEAEGETRRQ